MIPEEVLKNGIHSSCQDPLFTTSPIQDIWYHFQDPCVTSTWINLLKIGCLKLFGFPYPMYLHPDLHYVSIIFIRLTNLKMLVGPKNAYF